MPQGKQKDMRITQKELPYAPFCHSKAILREYTEEPCIYALFIQRWIGCGSITCASFQLRFFIRYCYCSMGMDESQRIFTIPYHTGHTLFIFLCYDSSVVTDKMRRSADHRDAPCAGYTVPWYPEPAALARKRLFARCPPRSLRLRRD